MLSNHFAVGWFFIIVQVLSLEGCAIGAVSLFSGNSSSQTAAFSSLIQRSKIVAPISLASFFMFHLVMIAYSGLAFETASASNILIRLGKVRRASILKLSVCNNLKLSIVTFCIFPSRSLILIPRSLGANFHPK